MRAIVFHKREAEIYDGYRMSSEVIGFVTENTYAMSKFSFCLSSFGALKSCELQPTLTGMEDRPVKAVLIFFMLAWISKDYVKDSVEEERTSMVPSPVLDSIPSYA